MPNNKVRYNRTVSREFKEQLLGPLKLLMDSRNLDEDGERYLFDVHLRERDILMVYCGTTRVINCHYNDGNNSLRFSAHRTYREELAPLQGIWSCGDSEQMKCLAPKLRAYFKGIRNRVSPRHYWNQKEGFWQNKLCVDYGLGWEEKDKWLILDREVVIGFETEEDRQEILTPLTEPYTKLVNSFQEKDPRRWGTPGEMHFGNELDILAVDSKGNLVCVELKHGTNTSGIYWGPYQLAVYEGLAQFAREQVVSGAKNLLRQKIDLGLLPKEAEQIYNKLLTNKMPSIQGVLAIAQPNPRSTCWEKLIETSGAVEGSKLKVALIGAGEAPPDFSKKGIIQCAKPEKIPSVLNGMGKK